MFHRQQNQPTEPSKIAQVLALTIHALSVSVEVFLHRRFGSRYLSLQSVFAFLLIILYSQLLSKPERALIYLFGLTYGALCVIAQIRSLIRRWRGDTVHSYYPGWPWLQQIFPRLSEMAVKKYIEPPFVFLIGMLFSDYDQPLAWYLMAAAVCLFAKTVQAESFLRRRIADMNDAVTEQQQVSESFRSLRRDF